VADHWRHFVFGFDKNKAKIHELCVSIKMQIATKVNGSKGEAANKRGEKGSYLLPFLFHFF